MWIEQLDEYLSSGVHNVNDLNNELSKSSLKAQQLQSLTRRKPCNPTINACNVEEAITKAANASSLPKPLMQVM